MHSRCTVFSSIAICARPDPDAPFAAQEVAAFVIFRTIVGTLTAEVEIVGNVLLETGPEREKSAHEGDPLVSINVPPHQTLRMT